MNYFKEEILNGIKIHSINTDKFKTNLIAIFLTTPLSREYITFDSVLSATLRRGSKNYNSQEEISKRLEDMYGAEFDCGLDKIGDNHILKFYLESINDKFLPKNSENIFQASFDMLFDLVFNPLIEDNAFKKEYVNQEKEIMRQRIDSKKDNKAAYAKMRCIEEMYKNEPTSLFKYGYVEDLEKINNKNLYEYFKKLINECKIDIFVSGNLQNVDYKEYIIKKIAELNLNKRNPNFILNKLTKKDEVKTENIVTENLDVVQGKLIIGLDVLFNEENIKDPNVKYQTILYNSILGGSANSKLFQNVREKASLAYTASSSYSRFKSNIFISCGIEIKNYDKALEIIRKQIEDMKNGEFTKEEIENVKKGIISSIMTIEDEPDSAIVYFFSQDLQNSNEDIKEYIEGIKAVTKEQIVDIANKIKINTIYFLSNNTQI